MPSECPESPDDPQDQAQSGRRAPPPDAKKSNRRVAVDLPGAYASREAWQVTLPFEQRASLAPADRELFWLASEVNNCAESARSLVLGEADVLPADIEAGKGIERRRLQRMLLAWFGLRAESEAPYRDARMLLTAYVLDQAGFLRSLRDGSLGSRPERSAEEDILSMGAVRASGAVAALYPSLATAMRNTERIAQIRAAIESAATSEKRTPWVLIAAVWSGIEKGAHDPERWRKDWYDHQHSDRP